MPSRFKGSRKVVYAIDYGTSNSLLAAVDENKQVLTLPLDESAPDPTVFRSVLYFPHQDLCHYGQRAVDEYNLHEGDGRLIRSLKKFLPSTSYVGSYIENRVVRLEDLIGLYLLELRKRANAYLDRDVDEVILGRPAKFSFDPEEDKLAEHRLIKASEIAGFKRVEFLPEPVAAAYDLKQRIDRELKVLVVDLGGGTSDFSVVRFGKGEFDKEKDILAIGGVAKAGDAVDGQFMKQLVAPYFGAEVTYRVPMGHNVQKMPRVLAESLSSPADIVQLRVNQVMKFFRKVQNWALSGEDKEKLQRLVVLVEDNLGFKIFERVSACKMELGEREASHFQMDDPGIEIDFEVNRAAFASKTRPVLEAITTEMNDTLASAGLKLEDVDLVYCTGGTSKLFTVKDELNSMFDPSKLASSDYFHSVIQGLAQHSHKVLF